MKTVVVVGAQWGDEGKGKVVDCFAPSFDYIARCQGGHNAGHTVIWGGKKIILQLVPSGILRPGKKAVIGTGVVFDPVAFLSEIDTLAKAEVDVDGRLFVSNRAHLIFPYHRELDQASEAFRGDSKIGTTSRGIGPAYEDKMARRGLRVADLLDAEGFRRKLEDLLREKNALSMAAYGKPLNSEGLADSYLEIAERIRPFVADTGAMLIRAAELGSSLLFEGAQGTMLDIDHGTYPYVTSSSATAGGASTGLGFPPARITGVVGIAKAYTTRVGNGPFPTEMDKSDAEAVRTRGVEFGAVTGRPRRCGWLDLMELRYATQINGINSLVVTKLDVLDKQKEIQVAVGYRYKNSPLTEMPAEAEVLERVTPVYRTLPGWCCSTSGENNYDELPQAARDYLRFISDELGIEIGMISTGPEREAGILRPGTILASWLT